MDLVRVARHRFHGYVGIRVIGADRDGTVYWTAYQQYSNQRTLEVFRWRNGRLNDLGSPGPGLAIADVNDRGQFVVFTAPLPTPTCPAHCPNPPQPPTHSYLWDGGKLTDLGSLGGANAGATAISDRGQIVGSSQVSKGDRAPFHAFVWQDGKLTDLGTLGDRFSEATGINDHGQVIGESQTARGRLHGFIWQHGTMADLGSLGGGETMPTAINERGQVIGQSSGQAFIWQRGQMIRLGKLDLSGYPLVCHGRPSTSCAPRCPGPKCGLWGSVPKAINDRGEVVGMTQTNSGANRAFLWRNGKLTDLGTLGGRSSEALAIGNDGAIVGTSDTKLVPWTAEQAPRPRPFLWKDGRMVELPVDYPSPSLATAITPSGTVILGAGGWPPHQALVWTQR